MALLKKLQSSLTKGTSTPPPPTGTPTPPRATTPYRAGQGVGTPVRTGVAPARTPAPRVPFGSEGPAAPLAPGTTVGGIYNLIGGPVRASEPGGVYGVPVPTPTTPTGGGGGSPRPSGNEDGGGGPTALTWNEGYSAEEAPSWWKGLVPSEWNPETEYASLINAVIPYLSPEDQRNVGQNLYRMFPKEFAGYNPETLDYPVPPDVGTSVRERYQSKQRAGQAVGSLEAMIKASGKTPEQLGPGYQFLRQILDVGKDFGGQGGEGQTRTQMQAALGALDPLLAETRGQDLAAFGPTARMLTNPFFSQGEVQPVSRDQSGQYRFGSANRKFF